MEVVVDAFHPRHAISGYEGNFFGVTLAHATAFVPGSRIFKVISQDPKTFHVTDEIGPFVVDRVTDEKYFEQRWGGDGQLTGMKYVYLTEKLRQWSCPRLGTRRRRIKLCVGDKIRVA